MSEAAKKLNQVHESYSPKRPEILGMANDFVNTDPLPSSFVLPDKSTPISEATTNNCPGYVTFANEFSYFMEYSGQGYGFMDNDGWRCDINYTLADILTGYAMRPSCLEVTADGLERLYHVAGFCRTIYSADTTKENYMSLEQMKRAISSTLFVLKQPVIITPIEDMFFGAAIIGYEQDGDVLVTYSYPPYFKKPDNILPEIKNIDHWYKDDTTLIIMGERRNALTLKEVYLEGIKQIRDYLWAGIYGEDRRYYTEWEAFLRKSMEDMIAQVRAEKHLPASNMWGKIKDSDTDEDIRNLINSIVDPTWCEMAERRYYIMHFFRQAIKLFPEVKDEMSAIEQHFGKSNAIMGEDYIHEAGHDPVSEAFNDPAARNRMADCVVRWREADEKGLELVEKLIQSI